MHSKKKRFYHEMKGRKLLTKRLALMRPTTFWLCISSVLSIGQNDQVQESCQEIVSKTLLLLEETEGNVVTFASPDDYLKINQEKRRDYKRNERQEDHRYDMDKLVAAQIPKDVLDCAKRGHAQSIKLAADLSLYGLYGVPVNATFSFSLIQSLTELADNEEPKDLVNGPEKTIIVPPLTGFSKNGPYLAQAYRQLGLLYATGMGIKRDYAHALVYTSLAALEGDLIAHQMMGYWYHSGIGVSRNCAKAAWHYQRVADVLNDISEDDPAGSKRWPKSVFALDKDGLYGVGASGSGNPAIYKKENHISEADLLLVYKLQADAGDAASQFMLGQSYYLGNSATSINYKKAIYYLTKSAAQYPAQIELDGEDDEYKTMALAASNAAGYLGIIYARGEGVEANLDIARQWFERGVQQDNALSHTWLGRMYLRGIGVSKDYDKGTIC
jgi:TPR repeat protein